MFCFAYYLIYSITLPLKLVASKHLFPKNQFFLSFFCFVLSIMGQIETKIFHKVPAKYLKFAESNTQLDEEVVQICWNLWRSDSRYQYAFQQKEPCFKPSNFSKTESCLLDQKMENWTWQSLLHLFHLWLRE